MNWVKARRKFLNKIGFYVLVAKPLRSALIVLLAVVIGVVFLSWPYYWDERQNFYMQVLVEAHGMAFDIAVIGILLFWLNQRGEIQYQISTYKDEIEDFRAWKSEESAFRTAGNIKRLNRHQIHHLDLAESYLVNTNLSEANLQHSNLNLANLEKARLISIQLQNTRLNQTNFNQANLNQAQLNACFASGASFVEAYLIGVDFREAFLIGANFEDSALMRANFQSSELSEANFKGANLLKANFKGARGLKAEQLMEAKNLHLAKLDENIWQEIYKINPALRKNEKS